MTELPQERERQRPRKPRPLPTVMAALAVFGVAFEFLAFQLSSGRDPAVGAGVTGRCAGRPVAAREEDRHHQGDPRERGHLRLHVQLLVVRIGRRAGSGGDLIVMTLHDLTFDAMGCEVRVLVGEPLPGSPPASDAAERARLFIADFEAALSRFRADSELTLLNEDPRSEVPASPLLRRAVRAGLWAAERTGGLVDPTLLDAIVAAGYSRSRAGEKPVPLADALALAPERRPARPRPAAEWRRIEVDDEAGTIRRPPGVGFDTGGSGKGLAADLLAERLRGYSRYVIDCGGDVRVGGFALQLDPFQIHARHPVDAEAAAIFYVSTGGIASSGIDTRVWRSDDGSFAHHLLDPSTGEPAWTGLVGVTALGADALEAETLSKAALLSGPDRARELLAARGGMLVDETGEVELVGPVSAKLVGRRSLGLRAIAATAGGRP